MRTWWHFFKPRNKKIILRAQFLKRYHQSVLIIHQGFTKGWLEQLFKVPGGAGYFRIDLCQLKQKPITPLSWLVYEYILPHQLPYPLLLQVGEDGLRLRHLTRSGKPIHPSEIFFFLEEIATRYHIYLLPDEQGFVAKKGLAIHENDIESFYEI